MTTSILAQGQPAVNLDSLRTDLERITEATRCLQTARQWLRGIDGGDCASYAALSALEEAHSLRLCAEARLTAAEGRSDG